MNTTILEILSHNQSLLSYNGGALKIPESHSNVYMGIGLWSLKDGLSKSLPLDIMQMLLPATLLRAQIREAEPLKSSNIILLIADSMAVQEGADPLKVAKVCDRYLKALKAMLEHLDLDQSTEIIFSSELEKLSEYQASYRLLEEMEEMKKIWAEDEAHAGYIHSQTAITHYMHTHKNVGVKIGWVTTDSSKLIGRVNTTPRLLPKWDELKFDSLCTLICPELPMQYLYAKAGLKQVKSIREGKKMQINIMEGCPYTAYKKDNRYPLQSPDKVDIEEICPLQKKVAAQWRHRISVCADLIALGLVKESLLPKESKEIKNNDMKLVGSVLTHWANKQEELSL